jgi:hypothetical protein
MIPYVIRNPNGDLNKTIESQLLEEKLDEFFKKSTIF